MEPTGNFGGMSPQELLKNRQAIADLAGSEDARQLMELLQRQGGQVRQAAQQAAAGSPERFMDYYTANGWRLGKSEMKDWKAVVRNWERQ